MATRFSVSLAHSGCDHTGFVVWEERERADARGASGPVVVGLPRGFVSLNSEDGAIEVVCAGCRQTIASAARFDVPAIVAPVDPSVAATDAAAGDTMAEEPAARDAAAATAAAPHEGTAPAKAAEPLVAPPATAEAAATAPAAPSVAPGAATRTAASADQEAGETADAAADTTAEDKVRADIEALFAEAEDVAPIRGDAIPPHLLDKLRHLADRMRQRRE
jgi:hypothetical protein